MRYRWKPGMWAHVMHRLSGLALSLYLLIHVIVTRGLISGPDGFEKSMKILENPAFRLLEIGLLGVVVYHALNGMRILIFDFFDVPSAYQKPIWYGVMTIFITLFIAGGGVMLLHIVGE